MSTDDHEPTPAAAGDEREPTDGELLAAARRGIAHLDDDAPDLDALWARIAADAFGDQPPTTTSPPEVDVRVQRPAVPSARPTGPRGSSTRPPRRRSLVRDVQRRRGRTIAATLVGVAAVLMAVLGVTYVVTQDVDPVPVATFRMDPLDERVAEGVEGRLVATDTGQAVEVDLDGLPAAPAGTFYELWLLDLDAGQLVSLGPVDPSSSYAVPAAVAATAWPTIDVSVEPVDGDPTHSSDSVLRGPVVAAPETG